MNSEIAASLANLAMMLAAYYLNLVEHGFPRYMAIDLVRDFQRMYWERALAGNVSNAPEKTNVQRD